MSDHRWRSERLGQAGTIALEGGTLEYFERGEGPALLFSHGWLANANLWRAVVDDLATDFRCIVLDLPLGSHRTPMSPGADLSPSGIAGLIAGAVEQLELRGATLVGNDSGGAYSQIALAEHAGRLANRVSRLVLTSCETAHDEWPPQPFDGLPAAAADPAALRQALTALQDPAVRRSDAAFGLLLKHEPNPRAFDSYALPAGRDERVLHDVAKAMATASTVAVRGATQRLIATCELPVLLIWSSEDRVFPLAHAQRYAEELKDARIARIDDAYSFTPEDQPQAVAAAIRSFALAPTTV